MAEVVIPPISIEDLSGGMISNVHDSLLPPNVAKLSVNLHYDTIGKATQRNGTTILGTTVSSGNTCRGLASFTNSTETKNRAVAVFNQTVYGYDGSAWASIGAVASTAKVRFASFLDLVFRVGGGSATMTWDGTIPGAFGATNVASAPSGTVIETFKERVYVAGDTSAPDRLYFSSIVSSGLTITWTTATDYIDINPEDGDHITALKKTSNLLLIFKTNAMYRFNGSAVDADVVVGVGTTSQESVAEIQGMVFFFSPLGIFMTNGGYPVEVSRPIDDWIRAISPSFYSEVAGFGDSDHYYCSVGNVTINGRSFTNVWLVYTLSSKNWCVYSFQDSFRNLVRYRDSSSAISYIGGDTGGRVQTVLSGTTDNGTAIFWEYRHKEMTFGSRATTNTVVEISTFITNGKGTTLSLSADGGPAVPVGEIRNTVDIHKSIDKTGHFFQVVFSGANKNTPVVLNGFEYTKVVNQGYVTRN